MEEEEDDDTGNAVDDSFAPNQEQIPDLPTIDAAGNLVWFWWLFFVLALFMILIIVALFLALRDPSWQQESSYHLDTGTIHSQVLGKIYENMMNTTQQNVEQSAALTSMLDRKYPMHMKKMPTQRVHRLPRQVSEEPDNETTGSFAHRGGGFNRRPRLRDIGLARGGTELRVDGDGLDRNLLIEFSSAKEVIKSPLQYSVEHDYWSCTIPPVVLNPPLDEKKEVAATALKWNLRLINNDAQSLFIRDALKHDCSNCSTSCCWPFPPSLPEPYLTFGSTPSRFQGMTSPIEVQVKIHCDGGPILDDAKLMWRTIPKCFQVCVESVERVTVSQQSLTFEEGGPTMQKIQLSIPTPGSYRVRVEPRETTTMIFSTETLRAFSLESHVFQTHP
jgi:hypothetical protein